MKSVLATTLASVGFIAMTSGAAQAGVTISLTDTGSDVVATASGSLNLAGLTDELGNFLGSGPGMLDFGGDLGSSQGLLLGNPVSGYTLRSGPTFSSTPYPFFGAEEAAQTQVFFDTASGDLLSLGFHGTSSRVGIAVANSYVSGAPLSATGTWSGLELSRLGVAAGDSFTWTWSGVDGGDFLTIEVSAVPEPSSYALLIAGLGLVGFAARRARSRKA